MNLSGCQFHDLNPKMANHNQLEYIVVLGQDGLQPTSI